jgi:hypothetical protein
MNLRIPAAELATATLMGFAAIGGAAAQSIRYEKDGRPQTYEFKPQPGEATPGDRTAATRQNARSNRPTPGGLPGGRKNIPWDEPGKFSGVPGVFENSATSLPARHGTKPARHTQKGAAQTRSAGAGEQEQTRSRLGQADKEPDGNSRTHASPPDAEPNGIPAAGVRSHGHPGDGQQAETAKAADIAAETRAKVIEQFRARALAEEQRRLDIEKNRNRRARPGEASAAELGNGNPEQQRQVQADPDYTGTVTTAPSNAAARSEKSGLKGGVCRMLFFGLLPGC